MELNELIEMVFGEYLKNDYYDMWKLRDLRTYLGDRVIITKELEDILNRIQIIADIAEIGLMNTEVSELLEGKRNDKDIDYVGLECADIAIRLFNYCRREEIDLEYYIIKKHEKNMQREKLHGKKV